MQVLNSCYGTEGGYRKPFIRKSQKPSYLISLARTMSHDHPIYRDAVELMELMFEAVLNGIGCPLVMKRRRE